MDRDGQGRCRKKWGGVAARESRETVHWHTSHEPRGAGEAGSGSTPEQSKADRKLGAEEGTGERGNPDSSLDTIVDARR